MNYALIETFGLGKVADVQFYLFLLAAVFDAEVKPLDVAFGVGVYS
jgi:hypothetical protein